MTSSPNPQPTASGGLLASTRVKQGMTVVAVLLCLYGITMHASLLAQGHWTTLWPLCFYLMVLVLFFRRHPSSLENTTVGHWFRALCGSFLFFALRPVVAATLVQYQAGIVVTGLGMFLSLLALSQLGRGFGIIAACRTVKTHGLYRVVRHPLYMGEEVAKLGILIQNVSWVSQESLVASGVNIVIYLAALGFQIARIRDEEALLSQVPEYAHYMGQVRYRLLPGVY